MSSTPLLLVEDEAVLISLLERSLGRRGFQVVACNTGQAGLDELRRADLDFRVAVVDLTLPDGRGEGWIEQYLSVKPDLQVIATSGLPPIGLQESRDVAFLAKPFSSSDLLAMLHAVLQSAGSASASSDTAA